jgi:hypothetical protein
MKILKLVTVLLTLVVGISSFSTKENINTTAAINLEAFNVEQMLSQQELGCRPTSGLQFYVKSELVAKSRGLSTINAQIYVFDKNSGQSNLLAEENIMIPSYKDAVLNYDSSIENSEITVLKNGDKIIDGNTTALFTFSELVKYETIYNSYIKSTNKLLNIHRTL